MLAVAHSSNDFFGSFLTQVTFSSKIPYAELAPAKVLLVDDGSEVKFSAETVFYTDKFEIV